MIELIAVGLAIAAFFTARQAHQRTAELAAKLELLDAEMLAERARWRAFDEERVGVRPSGAREQFDVPLAAAEPEAPRAEVQALPEEATAAVESAAPPELPRADVSPWRFTEAPEAAEPAPGRNFEELFGRRLPVWGGGIALALAGFFLVRYSIEVGLVTPLVRCLLGLSFGLGLVAAAEAARRLPRLAADPRVSQALAGAGVATLYGVVYMASNLYGLVSPTQGFAAMAVVTAGAMALSLRYGAPTAVLGLIGGFATPALVNTGEDSVPALLGYLLLTAGGLLGVARTQGWRWLGFLALAGGFGWSGVLLATELIGVDVTGTGLFLVILAIAGLVALRPAQDDSESTWSAGALPLVAGAVAFVQLAVLIGKGGFGWTEWGLYALLSIGVTILALRERTYRLLPPGALAIALVTLALWPVTALASAAVVAGGVFLLFALPGFILSGRRDGLLWAGQAVAATLLPVALLDRKLGPALPDVGWALLCLALATAPLVASLVANRRRANGDDPRPALFAVAAATLAGAAAGYVIPPLQLPLVILLIGLLIAVTARAWSDNWLPSAAAATSIIAGAVLLLLVPGVAAGAGRLLGTVETTDVGLGTWALLGPAVALAAIGWLDASLARRRAYAGAATLLAAGGMVQLAASDARPIVLAATTALVVALSRRQVRLPLLKPSLGVGIVALLWSASPLVTLVGEALPTLIGDPLLIQEVPTVRTALLYLLAPAAIFAATLWRWRPRVARLHIALAAVPATLALCAAFIAYKHLFGIADAAAFVRAGFAERVLLTQLLFALGMVVYRRAASDPRLLAAARALTALAAARFLWFDVLVFNPLVTEQAVGGWPVLNLLPVAYGLPSVWLLRWRTVDPLFNDGAAKAAQVIAIGSLILLAGLLVRQSFHPDILARGSVGTAETYAYSLAGLVMALLLLLWGTARADALTRFGSLGLMLATVGKVFLSDAAELEGLLRIASFFGLGISLIGVSWFYTRHVFGTPKTAS